MDLPTDIITELYNIIKLDKDAHTLTVMRSVCKTWNTIVKPFRLIKIHVKFRDPEHIPILYIRTESSYYCGYSWSTPYQCFENGSSVYYGSVRFDNKILSQNLLWRTIALWRLIMGPERRQE